MVNVTFWPTVGALLSTVMFNDRSATLMLEKSAVNRLGPRVSMTVICPAMPLLVATISRTTAPTLVTSAPLPPPICRSFCRSIKYSRSGWPVVFVQIHLGLRPVVLVGVDPQRRRAPGLVRTQTHLHVIAGAPRRQIHAAQSHGIQHRCIAIRTVPNDRIGSGSAERGKEQQTLVAAADRHAVETGPGRHHADQVALAAKGFGAPSTNWRRCRRETDRSPSAESQTNRSECPGTP
jgi:hypothetical protein